MNKKQIILVVIGVAIIIALSIYHFSRDIRTVDRTGESKLPEINISSNDSQTINQYLKDLYENYTADGKSNFNYTYDTYENKISILVDIDIYDEHLDNYKKKYLGFNIDKDTGQFIDKEEVANLFGYELTKIIEVANNRLNDYYEKESKSGYVDNNECNFECYLSYVRGITNIYDNIELVIKDKKLILYLNFEIDDFSSDKDYFDSLDYNPHEIVLD